MFKRNLKYKILTPNGFEDFDGINKEYKETIKIIFSNGKYIRVSKDHIFDNIKVKNLCIGDFIPDIEGGVEIIDIIKDNKFVDVYDPLNVENNLYYGNDIVNHNCEFLGSANTVIDAEVLKEILGKTKNPILVDLGGHFRVYEKPLNGAEYVLGCLPEGEKVKTDGGIKNIEEVLPKNKLYDIDGNLTDINNIQIYKDFEGCVYDVNLYGCFRSTKFTGEHPIYSSISPEMKRDRNHYIYGNNRYRNFNFYYNKVKNLSEDDWVCFPNIYRNKKISMDKVKKIFNNYGKNCRKDFIIDDNILENEDFWWFLGIWIGDGWIQNRKNSYSVHTCHNATSEYEYTQKIKNLFSKYDRRVLISEEKNNTIYTQFNSKHLHQFIVDNFGKYAQYKKIPEWLKYIPNKYKIKFVKGYLDSDGCIMIKNNKCHSSFVSISLELLEGIQDILFSLDIFSSLGLLRKTSIHKINEKYCNTKETYHLTLNNFDTILLSKLVDYKLPLEVFSEKNRNKRYGYFSPDKNFIYFRIRKIDKSWYKGNVYNFETKSGTFMCRNIPTHNCDIAKGTGEHYSTIQVLRIDSTSPVKLEQVATYECNTVDPYHFSAIANRIAIYYNNAYIMAENNGIGWTVVTELHWNFENEGLVNSGSKETALGVRAQPKTKQRAVILMKKFIEGGMLKLNDSETVKQLTDFTEKANGAFRCENLNDDLVSGLYWACYIFKMDILDEDMTFAKNENDEYDAWGILGDTPDYSEEDWSWITM